VRLDPRDSFSTTFAATDGQAAYSRHVNPQWVRLLDLLELNADYVECIHSIHSIRSIHPAMFGQILVNRLYRDHGIPTQICGHNFMVLKAAPPLNAAESSLDGFVRTMTEVPEAVHSSKRFWQDALELAGRAIRI
jgi:hypothetical protein